MDVRRTWVDRAWTVGVIACGSRVWGLMKRPVEGGGRWRHQVVEQTPASQGAPVTPQEMDCVDPVVLPDGAVLVRTDGGVVGGAMQVAERTSAGGWRPWTDVAGGVVAFAVAEACVVALEREKRSAEPWEAEVAVSHSGPVRLWHDWMTEVSHELVRYDRRTGIRTPLGVVGGRSLSQCTLAISVDGHWLVHTPLRVAADGVVQKGISVMDLDDRRGVHVCWGPANSDHSNPVFSPDGRMLAFVRHTRQDGAHGRRQLMVLDLETGSESVVATTWPHWLVPQAWTVAHGIVCLAMVDGQMGAFSVRPGDSEPVRLDTGTWSWDAVAVGDSVWGVGSRLSTRPAVRPIDAIGPATVVAAWSDPAPCPTLFWPAGGAGRRPLVLMVHGGPVSAWADAWHPRQAAAFFHELGCHVLMPNPVGSMGFGDAHVDAIWCDWDRCIEQLVTLLHQAVSRADVSSVLAFGGSFGGWAVNRLATRSDVPALAGVITHAGIFDHHTMHAACDEPAAFRWHLGPTIEQRHRASPARDASSWRSPTLILHGARDFNVPVEQAISLHHTLDALGVEHRLVVFPDEGHHILTPRGQLRWWDEIRRFCVRVTASSVGGFDAD